LKKLLLHVIIGGLVAEANATAVFELPTGIPGIIKTSGIGTQECVGIPISIGVSSEYIYFPMNGSQPTTKDVAKYSCANVGAYDEDHQVTKWYIKAFGGDTGLELAQSNSAPVSDTATKFGFDASKQLVHIITIAKKNTLQFQQAFWKTFRTVAANPVGRVLLYRIFIEVRRNKTGRNGVVDGDVLINTPIMIAYRNKCRSISIQPGSNAYSSDGYIEFTLDDTTKTNVVSNNIVNESTEVIRTHRTSDIGLFHEMLHWFHFLRDTKRYSLDSCCTYLKGYFSEDIEPGNSIYYQSSVSLSPPMKGKYYNSDVYIIDIANHHYKVTYKDNKQKETSSRPWGNDYEELRTILGSVNSCKSFRPGDELSENLYRLSKKNSGMRFGHVCLADSKIYNPPLDVRHAYFEDTQVVEMQRMNVVNFASNLLNTKLSYTSHTGTLTDPNILEAKGLGGCKIR